MSDQYGLKAHNRRIANPRTVYHTPTYYRVRSAARGATKLLVACFWFTVFWGVALGVWVGALALGEWVASW